MEEIIPVAMLNDRRLHRRLDPESIRDVLVDMVRRYLYTKLSLEQLTTMDEPNERATRRAPKAVFDETDQVPRYELRHLKAVRWSQTGLIEGLQPVGRFIQSVDAAYHRNLKQLSEEQPNCDWRLVAAMVLQVDLQRTVQDGFQHAGAFNGTPDPDLSDVDRQRPTVVRTSHLAEYTSSPDIQWQVPMVFADIARAELLDPQTHEADGKPGPMAEYIVGRRIRQMPGSLRKNRDRAIAFLTEFTTRREELKEGGLALRPKFSEEQLLEIRQMREEGTPPARIAKLLGLTMEELVEALGT